VEYFLTLSMVYGSSNQVLTKWKTGFSRKTETSLKLSSNAKRPWYGWRLAVMKNGTINPFTGDLFKLLATGVGGRTRSSERKSIGPERAASLSSLHCL
jgi:hypothetical protein